MSFMRVLPETDQTLLYAQVKVWLAANKQDKAAYQSHLLVTAIEYFTTKHNETPNADENLAAIEALAQDNGGGEEKNDEDEDAEENPAAIANDEEDENKHGDDEDDEDSEEVKEDVSIEAIAVDARGALVGMNMNALRDSLTGMIRPTPPAGFMDKLFEKAYRDMVIGRDRVNNRGVTRKRSFSSLTEDTSEEKHEGMQSAASLTVANETSLAKQSESLDEQNQGAASGNAAAKEETTQETMVGGENNGAKSSETTRKGT